MLCPGKDVTHKSVVILSELPHSKFTRSSLVYPVLSKVNEEQSTGCAHSRSTDNTQLALDGKGEHKSPARSSLTDIYAKVCLWCVMG